MAIKYVKKKQDNQLPANRLTWNKLSCPERPKVGEFRTLNNATRDPELNLHMYGIFLLDFRGRREESRDFVNHSE